MPFRTVALSILILDLLLLHGIVGWFVFSSKSDNTAISSPESESQAPIVRDVCGEECKAYIASEIEKITITPNLVSPTISLKPTGAAKRKTVHYFPIPGNGPVTATNWTDLPATNFYLDTEEYAGYASSEMEVNLKLQNGNGKAFVRLYDATNNRAVDGSEVETGSQNSVVISSGNLSIWKGRNLYRLQARSLTSDTTILESARLKIITEN